MSVVKRLDKFIISSVPQDASPELRNWLREELERFALIGNASLDSIDRLRAAPRMYLAGDADDFILDTLAQKFVNYTQSGVLGDVPVEPDRVTGNITIPLDGVYRFTFFAYGLQPSVTQNETIRLLGDVDGVRFPVAVFDVASNQTQDRTFSGTVTRYVSAGNVLSMWMDASGPLGTFQVQSTTLECTIVTSDAEIVAEQAQGQIDINWV